MPDRSDVPRDLEWYRARWKVLTRLFPGTAPDEVVGRVAALQEQLDARTDEQARLEKAGFRSIEQALRMIDSMEEQLTVLYEERETAARADPSTANSPGGEAPHAQGRKPVAGAEKLRRTLGISSAEEIVAMVNSLTAQLEVLYENQEKMSAHGIRGVDHALSMIESMREQLEQTYGDHQAVPPPQAIAPPPEVPAFVDEAVLRRLDSMPASELDALDFGVLELDDAGVVRYANEAALQLPDIESSRPADVEGRNFFFELAPSTNNHLFRGRFRQGVAEGALNVRFPYTFVSRKAPPRNLVVHLYRSSDDANWILFDTS